MTIYGLIAEFEGPEALTDAARRAWNEGYRRMDALTPFPVEGLAETLGMERDWIAPIMLAGALLGAGGGFLMQVVATVWDYPHNIGGRPLFSWPSYIPITFELGVLLSGFAGFFAMLWLNGLPRPYHPVFNAPDFDCASRDRFFLLIEARDTQFDPEATARFLAGTGPLRVFEVAP